MSKGFTEALAIILQLEGGYSDDKDDSGGKTNYGITEAVARENGYYGDMREIPEAIAAAIYRNRYWDACLCDKLPWPMALYVFDSAVNQGPGAATLMMQSALGVTEDGVIGPATIAAASKSGDWHAAKFMALRGKRYANTNGAWKYLTGWLTRTYLVARLA